MDEIIATYKKNVVMSNLVTRFNFKGKRGDTLNIPAFTRGSATAKSVGSQVTLENVAGTGIAVSINKWYEKSYQLDDLVAYQTLGSMRNILTDNAGYALAKQVDTDLIQLGRAINGGVVGTSDYATAAASTNAFIGGDGKTVYNSSISNASVLTDAGIRRTIQRLDDADVPLDGRAFVLPPAAKNSVLGIANFTTWSGQGTSNLAIKTGIIGDIYGIEVYVSSNADTAAGTSATDRVALMLHKDAFILALQQEIRVQTQYKLEYLADIIVADTVYGISEMRDNAAVALAVPASGS